jgi:hypothetical protein
MGVQAHSVHKRIAVYKQGWAIIILKCQRGHDNVHKRIAVYKQGWAIIILKCQRGHDNVHKHIAVYKQGWAIIILKCQRGHDNVHKHIAVYKQGCALLHRVIWLVLRNESRCAPLLEVHVDELTVLGDDQPTDRPNKSKHNDALEGRPCEDFTVAD